ncbi:MAG: hypothetical protein HOP14_08155 [Acidobacteria bacterium]|nr:hypothetical protein [Acidobacteriota bacterium]
MRLFQPFSTLAVAAALVLGVAHWAGAQTLSQTQIRELMVNTTSAHCEFSLMAVGTWSRTGEPTAEVKPATLTADFLEVDTSDGTASIETDFGVQFIIARQSQGYLHFLYVASTGPVYTTTIFDRPAGEGRYLATHSRHEFTQVSLPGFTSRPEQYYGWCEMTE